MPPTIGKRRAMRCPTQEMVYSAARGNTTPKSHWHYRVGDMVRCTEPLGNDYQPTIEVKP